MISCRPRSNNVSFKVFGMCTLLLLALTVLACEKKGEGPAATGRLVVVTTLFPLYDFARDVGGGKAEVSLLLPPGLEPHNFEPRPGDIIRIQNADLFVYTGSFMEPWAEKILSGIDRSRLVVVDAGAGTTLVEIGDNHEAEHRHGKDTKKGNAARTDPHIWLDFSNAARMVDHITDGFVRKVPWEREFFENRATALKKKLLDLDRRYREALAPCRGKWIVHAGHFTFGYLAKRYGLRYVSAYPGVTPDAEPTPRRMLTVVERVKRSGIKTIFCEELLTPRVAETISKETGARFLLLHGAHNVTKEEMEGGATFLSLMEKNLENLKMGLECP